MFLQKYFCLYSLAKCQALLSLNICLDVPMLLGTVGSCYQNNWPLPVQNNNVVKGLGQQGRDPPRGSKSVASPRRASKRHAEWAEPIFSISGRCLCDRSAAVHTLKKMYFI